MSNLVGYLRPAFPILTLAAGLAVSGCAQQPERTARAEPDYCGGDFGLAEEMTTEIRGRPTFLTPEDYKRC